MSRYSLIGPIVVGSLGAGCGVIHPVERAPAPPVTLPEAYPSAADAGSAPADGRWWESFGDAELNGLVSAALDDNFDVKAAVSRLAFAQAASNAVLASQLPSVNGEASVSQSRQVFNFGDRGMAPGGGGAFEVDQGQTNLGLNLAYEVDVWGRVYGLASAAEVEIQASEADVAATRIMVAGTVVDTWLQAIEQQALLRLLEQQTELDQTYLELTELRFRQGLASAVDVLQQRQQLLTIEAQRPPVEANLGALERGLSVLLGKAPGAVEVARVALPGLPPRPETGIPARLLDQRPDVRAARLRVVSADFQLGSAIAARFPRLNLTGSLGVRGFDIAEGLFDNWLANLVAGLTVPLTDQIRLDAEEKQARAQLDQAVSQYGKTVLTAMREVEDALARERAQERVIADLREQLEVGRATLGEARSRYRNGLSDYLPVLQALEAVQSAERQLVSAERQRLSLRVQLFRALGGSWADEPRHSDSARAAGDPDVKRTRA